ncbi:dihydropteroate synthase [candidate division WOR-3 bacterium]|uniref:dihydropteroate synthase n=1 Tax=candidate division WOR-3 bacterium TaxID=2052148 RepID=A0A660SGF4_UNCW3|nr:MAG: dihydropteroate synthase [candidate division WOR-3 bacterium]
MIWRGNGFKFDLTDRVLVMGIINLSPDSFYQNSYYAPDRIIEVALQMEEDGADIIDIGAQSTRPGADEIPIEEEKRRIRAVLPRLAEMVSIPISVDTYRARIAEYALNHGAKIINDISALRFDQKMVTVVKKYDCGIVIMHIRGKPKDMQKNPEYRDVVREVYTHLRSRLDYLRSAGIDLNRVVIDPGLGFGKRLEHNYILIRNLTTFSDLGRPILVGISRKSFTGVPLNIPPQERLATSIALETIAIMNGAKILRVHDVKEVNRVVRIIKEFTRCQSSV